MLLIEAVVMFFVRLLRDAVTMPLHFQAAAKFVWTVPFVAHKDLIFFSDQPLFGNGVVTVMTRINATLVNSSFGITQRRDFSRKTSFSSPYITLILKATTRRGSYGTFHKSAVDKTQDRDVSRLRN